MTFFVTVAAVLVAFLAVMFLMKHTTVVKPPPAPSATVPTPVVPVVKQKKVVVNKAAPAMAQASPAKPAEKTVNIINVYPPPQPVPAPAPSPAPALAPMPAVPAIQNIINIYPPDPVPQALATPACPAVGYYRLSHEPTTDWRQFDDRGNWIPGHMELVRECRNGALVEFSRWVGHSLPYPDVYYPERGR